MKLHNLRNELSCNPDPITGLEQLIEKIEKKHLDFFLDSPYNIKRCEKRNFHGPVVQLVRTLACHARGRRFEPVPGRHFPWYNWDWRDILVLGIIPPFVVIHICGGFPQCAVIAQ